MVYIPNVDCDDVALTLLIDTHNNSDIIPVITERQINFFGKNLGFVARWQCDVLSF